MGFPSSDFTHCSLGSSGRPQELPGSQGFDDCSAHYHQPEWDLNLQPLQPSRILLHVADERLFYLLSHLSKRHMCRFLTITLDQCISTLGS